VTKCAMLVVVLLFIIQGVAAEPPELGLNLAISPTHINVDKEGLSSEDCTVRLTIVPPEQKRVDADVVLAIDLSSSMYHADTERIRSLAALDFVNLLDSSRDRVSVLGWQDAPVIKSTLSNNFDEARGILEKLPQDNGGTDINNALVEAISILDNSPRIGNAKVSRSIILLTDVVPDSDYNYDSSTVEDAKNKGYRIYTVGIKPFPENIKDLKQIAELTDALYVQAEDNDDLRPIYRDLAKILPYDVLATDTQIVFIVPPYLREPSEFDINVPEFEYIYSHDINSRINSAKDMWDKTTTVTWNWGTIVARDSPLTLSFKTKFFNPLPIAVVTSPDRTEPNSVLKYFDAENRHRIIQIPPGKLTAVQSPGFNGILAIFGLLSICALIKRRQRV